MLYSMLAHPQDLVITENKAYYRMELLHKLNLQFEETESYFKFTEDLIIFV